ncbi:5644_t:CDS:2 [Entrophospora sp. SA101]|nr:5644_t:CDS:2 [Entrophospora sp. SA101]
MIPVIFIDTKKVRELDIGIALRKLYYQPSGYQRTAQNLFKASLKAGYDFTIIEIRNWLHRQLLYLIHKARPKYIPCASFNKITIPNEVLQADIMYMPWDKIDKITYLFCLTVVDVASRFKWAVPIGTTLDILNMDDDDFSLEGILTSAVFKGSCEKLMKEHDVKIQKANSKSSMGIIERFNRTLAEKLFRIQDAHELLLPLPKRSRAWVKNLPIIIKDLNNTVTRLLGIIPNEAIKKKFVYAKASKPRYGPIGFDEVRLTYNDSVLYLLQPGELEGGRKRATDSVFCSRRIDGCQEC